MVGAAEEDLVGAAGGVVVLAEGWVEEAARVGGVWGEEGEGGVVCGGDCGCLGEDGVPDNDEGKRGGDDEWEDHCGGDVAFTPGNVPESLLLLGGSEFFFHTKVGYRDSPVGCKFIGEQEDVFIFFPVIRARKEGGGGNARMGRKTRTRNWIA